MILSISGLLALLLALTVHEFAHAAVAARLGDPTAELAGRKTLNPFAHLDFLGTLLLFLVGFGWGKPVPVDPFNLRDPRRDQALIALAGPAANFLTAIALALLTRLFPSFLFFTLPAISLNLALGFFNLLPLHPLDGGKILVGFLPLELANSIEETLSQYSLVLLLIIVFLPVANGRSLVEVFLLPLITATLQLLLGVSLWPF